MGKNNLSVKNSDVFALAVTKTTLVAGTGNGEATASMFFAGADVGLDSGDEHLDGLALVFVSPNNAPLATDDGSLATPLSTAEDTAVAIDVLANDTDPDGSLDPATVSIVSGPLHGTLSVNAVSGVVTYTPDADYTRQRRLQLHGQGRQRGHLEPGAGDAGGDARSMMRRW